MTPHKLLAAYEFHDSLIEKVSWNPKEKELRIELDFCAWMQKGYREGNPETMPVTLLFRDVSSFSSPTGSLDDYSILDTSLTGNIITFSILDDFHNRDYEISVSAKEVAFLVHKS